MANRAAGFPVKPTLRQPAKERGPRANRTVGLILGATKEIFLARGYAGTTVDEIAKRAGISRASFYTYFPSKRDVLLALGAESAHAGLVIARAATQVPRPVTPAGVEEFVRRSFAELDDHASFALAWTQAAHEDEDIRRAGMRRHLDVCRRLGQALGDLRGRPYDQPAVHGLAVFSMLERSWSYRELYQGRVGTDDLVADVAGMLSADLLP